MRVLRGFWPWLRKQIAKAGGPEEYSEKELRSFVLEHYWSVTMPQIIEHLKRVKP